MESSIVRKRMPIAALLDPKILWPAVGSAFAKLDPRTLAGNPVIFVLEIVTALTTIILLRDLMTGTGDVRFEIQIVLWLWFTVLFANFAEAIAEYNQALTIQPKNPQALVNLALVYYKTGRTAESREKLESALPTMPNNRQVTFLLADYDVRLGD